MIIFDKEFEEFLKLKLIQTVFLVKKLKANFLIKFLISPIKSSKKNYFSTFLLNTYFSKLSSILTQHISRITYFISVLFFCSITMQIGCERPTDNNQTNDGIPPAVPVGLRIYYASDGEILVEWLSNIEPDLKGYNVYRKVNNDDYSFFDFTNKSYYLDDSLNYDDEYFYKISAVDIWEEESEQSYEVSAKPINRYNPQKPIYLEINARNWEGKISIYLNWEPNEETDVAGYNVYKGIFSTFIADSTSLIGFTIDFQFNDTSNIQLYTNYYYKIRAVDKGNLLSEESSVLVDQVYALSEPIFPANNSLVNYFNYFRIKTIQIPATYKILVQTNEYFGEFWSKEFSSSVVNDTITINFNPPYLYPYVNYYWRIITYSNNNTSPNSISPLYKFKVKP